VRQVKLEDMGYGPVTLLNFADFTQHLVSAGDGFLPVEKIRITIDSVYPGERYRDLCISEIIILGREDEDRQ
jgi:hypothetical protein